MTQLITILTVDTASREVRPVLSDLSSSHKRDTCTDQDQPPPRTSSRGPSQAPGTPGGTSIQPPRSPSSRTSDATSTSQDQQLRRTTCPDRSLVPDTCIQAGPADPILIRREVSSNLLRGTSASPGSLNRRLVLPRGERC